MARWRRQNAAVQRWEVCIRNGSHGDQTYIHYQGRLNLACPVHHLLMLRNAVPAVLGPCHRLGPASAEVKKLLAPWQSHSQEEIHLLLFDGNNSISTVASSWLECALCHSSSNLECDWMRLSGPALLSSWASAYCRRRLFWAVTWLGWAGFECSTEACVGVVHSTCEHDSWIQSSRLGFHLCIFGSHPTWPLELLQVLACTVQDLSLSTGYCAGVTQSRSWITLQIIRALRLGLANRISSITSGEGKVWLCT